MSGVSQVKKSFLLLIDGILFPLLSCKQLHSYIKYHIFSSATLQTSQSQSQTDT